MEEFFCKNIIVPMLPLLSVINVNKSRIKIHDLEISERKADIKSCPFLIIISHFYISKHLKINSRATSISVYTSCPVYVSLLIWSTRQHCCICVDDKQRSSGY